MRQPTRTLAASELPLLDESDRRWAPPQLHTLGDVSLLERPRVAISGPRSANLLTLIAAGRLANTLAHRGVVIVSGLAAGVDTRAHWGAIYAEGHTIAVLGTPLSGTYPASNAILKRAITRRSLLVSEFDEGTPTRPRNFTKRNRTIALLAQAVVLMGADARGSRGTECQGWEALRLGRPLYLAERIFREAPELAWPRKMLEAGARVLTEERVAELYEPMSVR